MKSCLCSQFCLVLYRSRLFTPHFLESGPSLSAQNGKFHIWRRYPFGCCFMRYMIYVPRYRYDFSDFSFSSALNVLSFKVNNCVISLISSPRNLLYSYKALLT